MPELKPIVFIPVTDKNVEQLRLLNTTIFPVRYNDDFYKKVYVNPKLAQFGLFNDTPIGAVAGRIEESKETKMNTQLYIMTLGVLEPYRSLGAGAKLLRYLIDLVKTDSEFKELQTIVLHVQTSNASALKFYAKFGFEVTGLIENYYQKLDPPDCHILTLQVDRSLEPEPEPEPALAAESARQARVNGLQEEEKEGAQAGAANGYGTIAVDLAEEARKLKEMKAKGLNPDGEGASCSASHSHIPHICHSAQCLR